MKADRIGTPSEQARANAGWRTAGDANRARRAGEIPGDQCCAMCAHLEHTGEQGGWRCTRPTSTPVRGWATGFKCWCTAWDRAGDHT